MDNKCSGEIENHSRIRDRSIRLARKRVRFWRTGLPFARSLCQTLRRCAIEPPDGYLNLQTGCGTTAACSARPLTTISRFSLYDTGLLALLVLISLISCRSSPKQPVTLTFLDLEWSHDLSKRSLLSDQSLREFENQTGIKVKHLPAPETERQQLMLVRDLLRQEQSGLDVFAMDIVWTGLLSKDLLDLRTPLGKQLVAISPDLITSFTANGRLVAAPYHINVGALLYRADLLKKYGYREPPRTWDELETMAARIQQGERAAGKKSFWGFDWPGITGEGLTCVALEWQMAEGGGNIVENGTVTVNNPHAIRAWRRALRWIGWISPPGVTSYEDWDTINQFQNSDAAAFRRAWTSDYFLTNTGRVQNSGELGTTSLPSGSEQSVGVLGGIGLAIPKKSRHQTEAIALVKFLVNKEAQLEAEREKSEPEPNEEYIRLPSILKAYSRTRPMAHSGGGAIVSRPSVAAGANYESVSRAYSDAIHSVLVRKVDAATAAASLETELIRTTGFSKGSPMPVRQELRRIK